MLQVIVVVIFVMLPAVVVLMLPSLCEGSKSAGVLVCQSSNLICYVMPGIYERWLRDLSNRIRRQQAN